MMAASTVSNLSLQKQMEDLSTQLRQDIGEIKTTLKAIEERVRALETVEAGCRPLLESQIRTALSRIEDHDKKLSLLSDAVIQLQHANKILTWVGGLLGSTLVIWVVSQILAAVR
jgi:chromosome segregation ATPase